MRAFNSCFWFSEWVGSVVCPPVFAIIIVEKSAIRSSDGSPVAGSMISSKQAHESENSGFARLNTLQSIPMSVKVL